MMNNLKMPDNSLYSYQKSTARRNVPHFSPPASKQLWVKKRLSSAIQKKDFNKDATFLKLRLEGYTLGLYYDLDGNLKTKQLEIRRATIRRERCETLTELSKAFIEHCDYSLNSEYLFEISYPPQMLAKLIGQHHTYAPSERYPHGRSAYDCVLNALYDFEGTGQVVVVRQFDKAAGTNKAARIFLTPVFFENLGMNKGAMLKTMENLRRVKKQQGKQSSSDHYLGGQSSRRQQHSRVADITRSDLIKRLRLIKENFIEPTAAPLKTKVTKRATTALSENITATNLTNAQIIASLKAKIAPAFYHIEKSKLDALNLSPQESQERLITALKQHLP